MTFEGGGENAKDSKTDMEGGGDANAKDAKVVALFGATGRTGSIILSEALGRGWHVRVLVRDAKKLPAELVQSAGERLTVVEGGLDAEKVRATLGGGESGRPAVSAVLSALGPSDNGKERVITRALECIVEEMGRAGVRRPAMTAGAGLPQPGDTPGLADRLFRGLLGLLAGNVLADMAGACRAAQAAPELEWTIARAGRLTDGGPAPVRAGPVGGPGMGVAVSRGSLARFLVEAVEKGLYVKEAPMVCN